jgi:DNA modification methylase
MELHNADCLEILEKMDAGSVDLIVTDPPYGISYSNRFEDEAFDWDRKSSEEYVEFTRDWLNLAHRVLRPEGSVWLSYGITMIEEFLTAIHQTPFHHHYENAICMARHKGRGSKKKLKSLREEWMHLTVDPKRYTWNPEEYMRKVVVPYTVKNKTTGEREKRGWDYGPDGKTPIRWSGLGNVLAFHSEPEFVDPKRGNLGNVLDLTSGLPLRFDGEPSDVTFFAEPSYLDTFQRQRHSAQKPIMMMVMLVMLSSKKGDVVLDPFMGSGSTGVASKICDREFIGVEREIGTFETAYDWISNVDMDKAEHFVSNHVRSGESGFKFGV